MISLPQGTFNHSDTNAQVKIEAAMPDGSPLPEWIKFDAVSGKFDVTPPPGSEGTLDLKITAIDSAGNRASTNFIINIGNPESSKASDGGTKTPEKGLTDTDNTDTAPDQNGNKPGARNERGRDGKEVVADGKVQPKLNTYSDSRDAALRNFVTSKALKGRPSFADQLTSFNSNGQDAEILRALQRNFTQKRAV